MTHVTCADRKSKKRRKHDRPKCKRRDRDTRDTPADVTECPPPPSKPPPCDVIKGDAPDDLAESPPLEETPPNDVIMEDPSPDVITGDSAEAQMSEEERACYRGYIDKKMDEYEPIWVS